MAERVFVWAGGVAFVSSLAFCAGSYFLRWSGASGGGVTAIAVDAVLVTIFAAHHSVFARDAVKHWLTRRLPERLLRSVYVWTASLLLWWTCAAWRPVGYELFDVNGVRLWLHAAVQLLGVWVIARAVRHLAPLELAGIRREAAVQVLQIAGPYRLVRHPLYLGWILLVFGSARMTGDRLTFAVLTTAYLIVAIPWEERSLARSLGDEYARYRRLVRWRVIPFIY